MLPITIYGKESSTFEFVRWKVDQIAKGSGVDFSVYIENDLNKIIAQDIMHIPAVKIDGDLLQMEDYDFTTFFEEIKEHIDKTKKPRVMKTIVVPVDFSEVSEQVSKYAVSLASDMGASIKLLHVYRPAPIFGDQVFGHDLNLEDEFRQKLDNTAVALKAYAIKNESNVEIETMFQIGFPGEEIQAIASRIKNSFIVIGSTGSSNTKAILGSVSTKVTQNAECPVIVVPPGASYNGLDTIVYASDDPEKDSINVIQIKENLMQEHSMLNVIHVNNGNDDYNHSNLERVWDAFVPQDQTRFQTVTGSNIAEALDQYADDVNADMMIIARRDRSGLSALFNRSVGKQVILKSHTPVLVLPSDLGNSPEL